MFASPPPAASVIMVDDFDGEPNWLSNLFGPRDLFESTDDEIELVTEFFSGNALRLMYDHSSADSGWTTQLGGQDADRGRDLSDATSLRFHIYGLWSTTRIRVELTDAIGTSATEDVTGIDSSWSERTLDLTSSFPGVDLSQLTRLAFVVPQDYSDDPDMTGVLYFDEIYFQTGATEPTDDEELLLEMARRCFRYFWELANTTTGFAPDRAINEATASVAGIGYQLSSLPVGVRHGWVTREDAAARAKLILHTLLFKPQRPDGSVPDESAYSGYKGLYYHFLDSETGLRVYNSELSTIDSSLCFAGVIDARMFFDGTAFDEALVRSYADDILDRVDWSFVYDAGSNLIYMEWTPESGLSGFWGTYTDETILMTLLAATLGSNPVPPEVFYGWNREQRHVNSYAAYSSLTGALFTYYQAHGWLNLRGRTDRHATTPVSWFRNGWAATRAQREFALAESGSFPTFGPNAWGLSDSSTPGAGYQAVFAQPRLSGEPDVHNGTVPPSAAASTLPLFVNDPENNLAMDAVRHYYEDFDDPAGIPRMWKIYGLVDAYNETGSSFWYGNDYLCLTQGSTLLAIENYLFAGATVKRVSSYAPLAATMDTVMWPAHDVEHHIIYAREAEQFDAHSGTPGMVIEYHADASSYNTLQLGYTAGNFAEYVVKSCWTPGETYHIELRYSEDAPGNVIAIEWDEIEIGRFTTEYSGGWNSFITSPSFEIGQISASDHNLRIVNTNGGTYGVNLDVIYVYAEHKSSDFDGDGDVDLADFATFTVCFTGSGIAPSQGCAACDLEDDGDVDLDDFAHFQFVFTGPRS